MRLIVLIKTFVFKSLLIGAYFIIPPLLNKLRISRCMTHALTVSPSLFLYQLCLREKTNVMCDQEKGERERKRRENVLLKAIHDKEPDQVRERSNELFYEER